MTGTIAGKAHQPTTIDWALFNPPPLQPAGLSLVER